jgi:hypothetical protein
MAFSLQVNYTVWATTAGQRILVPTFVDRGDRMVSMVVPHGR